MKLERKTIFFLLGGGTLLLTGAALSVFARSGPIKLASAIAIIAGLAVARLAGSESRWLGTRLSGQSKTRSWSWVDKSEAIAYFAAILLFVLVVVAALNNLFDDRLTYTFTGAMVIATAFWFRRRVLRQT